MNVDLFKQLHGEAKIKFEEQLNSQGRKLDPTGHEAWMPKETKFTELYSGPYVKCAIANPEYVLISKAKMAPAKNRVLLIEYIGNEPSKLFLELAERHKVDLEKILRGT